MDKELLEYTLRQCKSLIAVDSPSGYTQKAADYLIKELCALGYNPTLTAKGCVLADLGGEDMQNGLLLSAHIDTLGAIVREIKPNGRLRLSEVGGLQAQNTEAENCVIYTRFGGSYTGALQMNNPSVHVNKEYATQPRDFDGMEIVIDEAVATKQETEALGICVGDFVCFCPRTVITESGYIKSRFLDDKLSVAILLGYAKYVKENKPALKRRVYLYFTVFEEVGHGGAASIPAGVSEILGVDMGCVGEGLSCNERMVSICAKDSRGPSNYEVVTALVQAAKEEKLAYALDVYPHYGSDADVALVAGYDLRHALIGPGVYASHGYERSHIEGVTNTFDLLRAYIARM